MGHCMLIGGGGAGISDFVVCCADENRHTVHLATWAESAATAGYTAHALTPSKTSNSNGGCGYNTYWPIDLTGYAKLRIDAELTSIRDTTTENYIPSFGVASAQQTGLSSAFALKKKLIAGGETSIARCVQELDVSSLTGEYYVCYKGIATGTIYDYRLIK